MFKVEFETRDYKHFLKLNQREVCLSSDTPEDDDIKDVITKALEAYHEYQRDKLKHYMDYYISGDVNVKENIFDDIIKKEDISKNNSEFQIGQKVIISNETYNLERGIITKIYERVIIVEFNDCGHMISKEHIHDDNIDSRIKKDTKIIFNNEFAIIKRIEIINGKLHYEIDINNKIISIPVIDNLILANIDTSENNIFVQINNPNLDYNIWYGYIQYRIIQINKYMINIGNNGKYIITDSKNIIKIDIKYNKNEDINNNDVIRTVKDSRLLFNDRFGIVRCHNSEEYYIDFGNNLHHYKRYKFNKIMLK